MKMDEDVSIILELMVIILINLSYMNEILFPNYHMFTKHILKDLLQLYYFYITNTIHEEVESTNLSRLINFLDIIFLNIADLNYDKYE